MIHFTTRSLSLQPNHSHYNQKNHSLCNQRDRSPWASKALGLQGNRSARALPGPRRPLAFSATSRPEHPLSLEGLRPSRQPVGQSTPWASKAFGLLGNRSARAPPRQPEQHLWPPERHLWLPEQRLWLSRQRLWAPKQRRWATRSKMAAVGYKTAPWAPKQRLWAPKQRLWSPEQRLCAL